jgi:hypothetical protein
MKTINELRKQLKVIGFTVKTKSYSHGTHATYESLDGNKLTYNVFTQDTFPIWKKLFDWKEQHKKELKLLRENTGIIGLL